MRTSALLPSFSGADFCFVAMLFASAAVTGGMIMAYRARPAAFLDSAMYTFAYTVAHEIMDLYAVKMVAVFMISTSTVAIHTGVFARWIAFIGYAFALFLLLSGRYVQWTVMVFPLWVLLVSIDILIDK